MVPVARELGFENNPLFLDLPNHFPLLSQQWSSFVERLREHDRDSLKFVADLGDQLEKITSLRVSEKLVEKGIIHHALIEILYLRLLSNAGASMLSNGEFEIDLGTDLKHSTLGKNAHAMRVFKSRPSSARLEEFWAMYREPEAYGKSAGYEVFFSSEVSQ